MKINSLKFNNSTIHKMYHGNELVNKIGDAFTYMEASGDTPTPPTPVPYSGQYLTFVAEADNLTIGLAYAEDNVFQYSTDSGATWSDLTNNESTSSVNSGETIMFKASGLTKHSYYGIGVLTPSVNARVQGNIMSLVYGDNFARKTSLEIDSQFAALFWRATKLTSAENLIMPATTLRQGCYSEMFNGCTSLTTAPTLPATTLVSACYYYMFMSCTSLNYIKCLATDIPTSNCTYQWVSGVASTGTFVKAASMNDWTTGRSGIPNGWTVQNDDDDIDIPVDGGGWDSGGGGLDPGDAD